MISLEERKKLGRSVSYVGLAVNLFLFITKLTIGLLAGSVALVADAVNNLSDFASAIIILISFHIAARPADKDHPFGHARFEYIASAVVAMFVLFLGFELGKSSIIRIINPQFVNVSWVFYVVLIFAVTCKLILYFYYIRKSKALNSLVLEATAKDSLLDALASTGLIFAALISRIIEVSLDGYAGIIISLFILYSGISILRQTVDRILGKRPDKQLKDLLKTHIMNKSGVLGIHDLIIHDYGADNYFATAHVEVDANEDIMESHNLIDQIEREIAIEYNINLLLHMDPIDLDNPRQNRLGFLIAKMIRTINSKISMHDFRVQEVDDHLHLIFDLKVPDDYSESNEYLRERIEKYIRKIEPKATCFITIDRNYSTETVELET